MAAPPGIQNNPVVGAYTAPGGPRPQQHSQQPGMDPHGAPYTTDVLTGKKVPAAAHAAAMHMDPTEVRKMQQFLNNHGFAVAQDGVYGPQTESAAAAFRANHKSGAAWSAKHGITVHPAARGATPHGNPGDTVASPPSRTAQDTPGSGAGADVFGSLLSALLAGGGRVGNLLDPRSFGDAAAAPADALAAALQRQIGLNPKEEQQNQADISNWYGLDPNADSYKLSVLGRLATARTRDATAATDAAGNIGDIAKSLVSSIGGSANDGSGSVASAGADAAGTMAALGEASKQYADDMNPLLAAEARGRMTSEKASNHQALLDLQDKLAQAQGQAKSDRASAVMGVSDKNNSLAQQRFANEGNLLSTLAQLKAVDPSAMGLKDAKLRQQIKEIEARTNRINHPITKAGPVPKIDLAQAGNSIGALLGVAQDGSHQLPDGVSVTKLAYTIGSQLQNLGLKKGTPGYQRAAQTLISMFRDSGGNPIVPPASWFGPNS